jgi:hypothetical protein
VGVTEPDFSVALFYSTSAAIRGEKLAKEAGLAVKLIPVPRHLSSDCGVCLRCDSRDVLELRSLLEGARVEFEDIMRV